MWVVEVGGKLLYTTEPACMSNTSKFLLSHSWFKSSVSLNMHPGSQRII